VAQNLSERDFLQLGGKFGINGCGMSGLDRVPDFHFVSHAEVLGLAATWACPASGQSGEA
jgi:hypothetical protein